MALNVSWDADYENNYLSALISIYSTSFYRATIFPHNENVSHAIAMLSLHARPWILQSYLHPASDYPTF